MVEEDITIKHRTCVTVTCDTYDCVQLETALQTASLAGPDALCSRDHTPHFHWSPDQTRKISPHSPQSGYFGNTGR